MSIFATKAAWSLSIAADSLSAPSYPSRVAAEEHTGAAGSLPSMVGTVTGSLFPRATAIADGTDGV
ncbi:MAG: hypothetical protein JOZ69_15150 [Myxococcales bacterium]|nr:hypothetical protein [Myxococcales bacterium]